MKLKIDEEKCNNCGRCVGKCHFDAIEDGQQGYKIYIGGMWGKHINHGKPISKILNSKEDVLSTIEKIILVYREQGETGERLSQTIERIGFENIESQLLSDEIFDRKEDILNAQLHLVGGATC